MANVRVIRTGKTGQFQISLADGKDRITCLVSVATGRLRDTRSDAEKKKAAFARARALAKALDAAIPED
jgi:hypothetical protein